MFKNKLRFSIKILIALGFIGIFGAELRADTITVGMSAPKTGPLAGGSK